MALCFYLLSIALVIFGVWHRKTAVNPLSIFVFVWLSIVSLSQLKLSGWQGDVSDALYLVLVAMVLTYFVGYLACSRLRFGSLFSRFSLTTNAIKPSILNKLFLAWLAAELVEIIYSGGIPLIWKVVGSSKTYFDFGIPTVHGLMNSVGLVIILLAALFAIEKKEVRGRSIALGVGVALYYVALLTRQVVISAAIEVMILLLLRRRKQVVRLLIPLIFIGIIVFGILGNIRTGYEAFLYVANIQTNIHPALVGFYWVYMYLTMTVANLNSLVNGSFPAIGMNALADIVPSAIASLFGIQKGVNSIAYLVSPAFTVSGFFVGFYQGFKVVGVAVISAIYGALGGLIEKLRLEKPGDMSDLLFAIVIQITVLSFFDNLLMYLPNSFQIILVLVLYLFHCPSKWNWCVSKKSS